MNLIIIMIQMITIPIINIFIYKIKNIENNIKKQYCNYKFNLLN
jgi:hypothetical protein